jgi:hypothetical protein
MAIDIRGVDTAAGIADARARMPFRFGVITMRAAPLFTLAVEIEDRRARRATGYAADFLAFRWFDKRPDKSLADNCQDLIRTVHVARGLYLEAGRQGCRNPFELWRATYPEIERGRHRPARSDRLGARSLRALSAEKAVIIDEADGWLVAFREAARLGYRATSHKNCKGIYKSLQRPRVCDRSQRADRTRGAVSFGRRSVQSAGRRPSGRPRLGGHARHRHVERNGHHYFRGLGHLADTEKTAALHDTPTSTSAGATRSFCASKTACSTAARSRCRAWASRRCPTWPGSHRRSAGTLRALARNPEAQVSPAPLGLASSGAWPLTSAPASEGSRR